MPNSPIRLDGGGGGGGGGKNSVAAKLNVVPNFCDYNFYLSNLG